MPIYEYECRACGHQFEQLYAPETSPRAPHVADRICSVCSRTARSAPSTHVSSRSTRRAHEAKLVQRDKDVAQAEYEKKHHEEGH